MAVFDYTYKLCYLVNGKLKTYKDEGMYLSADGYSSKGLIMSHSNGDHCYFILTYKNGKIKVSNYLYWAPGDIYAKGIGGKTKISKSEYDRIFNKYYADGKYKRIKYKSIKDFK